jgi:hypothetical protein
MSASTLISRFGKPYTYRRYAAGSYVDGLWVEGAESFLAVADQVQVMAFAGVPTSGGLALGFAAAETAVVELPGPLDTGTNLDDWAEALTTAFEALAGVGAGNAVVELAIVEGQLYLTVSFTEDLAAQPLAKVELAANTLDDGGDAGVLVTNEITVPGVAAGTRRTAIMSLQTVSGREVLLLPEGSRTQESRKAYTTEALRTDNEKSKLKADVIEADDRLWKVMRVDPYPSSTRLPHYRVLAILVEDDNQPEE